jgi:transposase InsO family protein
MASSAFQKTQFGTGSNFYSKKTPRSDADPNKFLGEMCTRWRSAKVRYNELHIRCMHHAVGGAVDLSGNGSENATGRLESLRAAYVRQNGAAPEIGEDALAEYDRWFRIERREDVTRLDYVYQVTDVIERIVADLRVGHRLDKDVCADLLDSMMAATVVFGRWVGPVSECSPF